MSLRVASLPRPLASLAPMTACTFLLPCTSLYPCITLLTPIGLPYRAVRGRAGPGRPSDLLGLPAGPPAGGLVNPVRDSLGGTGGGEKTQIFSQFLADLGPNLGLQSSKPWLRMASSYFSVHFWHSKSPFCCQKPGFLAIFHGF